MLKPISHHDQNYFRVLVTRVIKVIFRSQFEVAENVNYVPLLRFVTEKYVAQ
jgi:hypothetical protein